MKVAIYGQVYHNTSSISIDTLLRCLKERGADVFIEHQFCGLLIEKGILPYWPKNKTYQKLNSTFELLISMGGDGTILRAITLIRHLGIPIVGLNTGRLGFLATIQDDSIPAALTQIFEKKYELSPRSLLTLNPDKKNPDLEPLNFALNEITISRKNTTSMITIETYLDGEYLTSYWADGLIVATPTGSTGYSLSCQGPVITPGNGSFVLTPIAPHNLNARPLVIPDCTEIVLKISGRENDFLVSLDSRITTVSNDAVLTLKKADFKINMIELESESFLKTLRNKLLWGEDRRN